MIDKKTISQIAKLSRIEINEDEANKYSKDLSKVLDYFDQISKIDTKNIDPMTTPVENEYFWREDQAKSDYSPEEMLQNAPDRAGNLFKVPPVV
jgi:aspartyl-tRNA(Asn)/glutamyl-tRNA(Gln) amidotransferase subunit C